MSDVNATTGPRVRRLSGPVLSIEIVLLVIALCTFGLLADVRLDSGNTVVEFSESFEDDTGLAILLGVLGLSLLLAFLLLFLRPRAPRASAPPIRKIAPAAPPNVQPAFVVQSRTDKDMSLGCRGCGTVFHHLGHTGEKFECPNCGRTGVALGHKPILADLHDEACPHCGAIFQRYLNHAECPSCHRSLDL